MSFECEFCKSPADIRPALVDSVTYDSEKDLLVEKVVSCSNTFLCQSCYDEIRRSPIEKQLTFFATALSDARVETIFQGAIAEFFYRSLIQILKHCIVVRDSETIQRMQMKDSRVPFLLKIIFNDFLQLEYCNDSEFILSQLNNIKIKAECLLCLAIFSIERGNIDWAGRTFLRAFDHARHIREASEKDRLLLRIGYGIAKLTLSLIPTLGIDEIIENISQVHMVISYLSESKNSSVDDDKNNILVLCQVAKLLGEKRLENAWLVSGVMSNRELMYAVRSKIMILREEVN